MEEEYYEEEFIEESDNESLGDMISDIRASLQDEFLKRKKEKEATAAKAEAKADYEIEEYEEEIMQDSHARESMQSVTTLEEPVYEYSDAKADGKEDDREELGDEGYLESIQSEFQKLFLERKAEKAKLVAAVAAAGAGAASPAIDRVGSVETIEEIDEDSDYEEQVIEKWVFGGAAPEPEDLEAACRALIPVIYKGENVDPETMIRRTPLLELYRYLKQHYDYKKDIKQDLTGNETESTEAQTTLDNIFKKRAGEKASLEKGNNVASNESNGGQGKFATPEDVIVNPKRGGDYSARGQHRQDTRFNDSLYEEVLVESRRYIDSSVFLAESERTFEEFVERSDSEEAIDIEETIREEDEVGGSDFESSVEIVEETTREESDGSVVDEGT